MRPASPLLQPEKIWFNIPTSLSLCSYDVFILFDCLCVFAAKFPEISMTQRSFQQPQCQCLGQVASCTALCEQPSSWGSTLNWGSCWAVVLCLATKDHVLLLIFTKLFPRHDFCDLLCWEIVVLHLPLMAVAVPSTFHAVFNSWKCAKNTYLF